MSTNQMAGDSARIQAKVADFVNLSPREFFKKYPDPMDFVLALPKQKAVKRVVANVLRNMQDDIIIKRINGRDDSTYAIDLETGSVIGMTEVKPGGLVNTFSLRAAADAPKGTLFVDKDIDAAPAPAIGIIGHDTYQSIRAHNPEKMASVDISTHLNTSHAGLYLGGLSQSALEDIGRKPITIAATDRYEPNLRRYLESERANSPEPDRYIMPEIVLCDGGTEGYLDKYDGIDVICDIVDSGTSVLNTDITHMQLLQRSSAVVVARTDISEHFNASIPKIARFLEKLDAATEAHFKTSHPFLYQDGGLKEPAQNSIMSVDEFFDVMELDIETAQAKLDSKAEQPFYGVKELAPAPV